MQGKAGIDYWKRQILTDRLIGSFSIVCDVLVDELLRTFILGERLVLSMLGDELGM